MQVVEELKKIIDKADFEDPKKLKKQLDLLSKLPGDYNQQVFDKLYELATKDPNVITIFIDQFIKTSMKLLDE